MLEMRKGGHNFLFGQNKIVVVEWHETANIQGHSQTTRGKPVSIY